MERRKEKIGGRVPDKLFKDFGGDRGYTHKHGYVRDKPLVRQHEPPGSPSAKLTSFSDRSLLLDIYCAWYTRCFCYLICNRIKENGSSAEIVPQMALELYEKPSIIFFLFKRAANGCSFVELVAEFRPFYQVLYCLCC